MNCHIFKHNSVKIDICPDASKSHSSKSHYGRTSLSCFRYGVQFPRRPARGLRSLHRQGVGYRRMAEGVSALTSSKTKAYRRHYLSAHKIPPPMQIAWPSIEPWRRAPSIGRQFFSNRTYGVGAQTAVHGVSGIFLRVFLQGLSDPGVDAHAG